MKKMMTKLLMGMVMLALTGTEMSATDLDAPVTPKPITTRSEIERGINAMIDAPPELMSFIQFFTAIQSENKQKNSDSEPFLFGLYYQAWHISWKAASNGAGDPSNQKAWEALAQLNFKVSSALAKKLNLSTDDIKTAAGNYYIPNEEKAYQEISKSNDFKGSIPEK